MSFVLLLFLSPGDYKTKMAQKLKKNDPKLPYVISFSNLIFILTLLSVMVLLVDRTGARALGCLGIYPSEKGEIFLFYQFRIVRETVIR